ncbi:MAG: hypothetical protein HND52_12725 [Ignavibacteriae bacterium]|jgi:hypothetical protein|nr:hypothetical protein [Ignavibacteriota bacterium]
MKIKLLTSIFILLFAVNLTAQNKGLGAGIMFGDPTGFSVKAWLSDNQALDFGLGYSFIPEANKISLHADYIFHLDGIEYTDGKIPIYYGFGARLRFRDSESGSFGARGVIGMLYYFKQVPVDLFFEIAPVFQLLPKTALHFDAALGARYYFN